MSAQKKLSTVKLSTSDKAKIGSVLDLEKKYFNILWKLFTSAPFTNDLKIIEGEIQKQYTFLQKTWGIKNKLKIPAERITRQYVYRNLSYLINHIYPSPISSDIAFITKDAVINIDIKTLDRVSNSGDISNLQFENNQSSFNNKNLDVDSRYPNSGVKVECLLPKEFVYGNEPAKPVLTFFFTIVYQDDGFSFSLCRDTDLQTIHLKCLPNGFTSVLFDFDIVDNFKTYTYFEKKDGFVPVYLTDNANELDEKICEFINNNPNYVLIQGRTKLGAYCWQDIHPKYNIKGVSWFPVPRQDKVNKKIHYYLEAVCKGNTSRVKNDKLTIRYDSTDTEWIGLKKHKLY